MKHTATTMLMLALVTWTASPVVALPAVGDTAPPLHIAEWVKGGPVDLQHDASKQVHLIEFWATWCPPCKESIPDLTKLQGKYKQDLVVVGITDPEPDRNAPKAIRHFVKQQGDQMDYTVAMDDASKTWNEWLDPVMGIPYAFLLNRDGRIVWQGSPLEPALDGIVASVIDGSYDVESAKREAEVNRQLQALSLPLQAGQWGKVWDGLIDVLKLDPANQVAINAITDLYAQQLKNRHSFRTWADAHIAQHGDNAKAMARLATALLGIEDYATRTPDLALKAARAAYNASKQRDSDALVAYAEALYQIGNLDEAIRVQTEAVALVASADRHEAQKVLDYYKQCKELGTAHG